jgi:hypothetical protein
MPKNRVGKNRGAVFAVYVKPSLKDAGGACQPSASGLNVISLIDTLATNYAN